MCSMSQQAQRIGRSCACDSGGESYIQVKGNQVPTHVGEREETVNMKCTQMLIIPRYLNLYMHRCVVLRLAAHTEVQCTVVLILAEGTSEI